MSHINPKYYRPKQGSDCTCFDIAKRCNFAWGNVIKYLWRWREKNGLEDLRKARWYVQEAKQTPAAWQGYRDLEQEIDCITRSMIANATDKVGILEGIAWDSLLSMQIDKLESTLNQMIGILGSGDASADDE